MKYWRTLSIPVSHYNQYRMFNIYLVLSFTLHFREISQLSLCFSFWFVSSCIHLSFVCCTNQLLCYVSLDVSLFRWFFEYSLSWMCSRQWLLCTSCHGCGFVVHSLLALLLVVTLLVVVGDVVVSVNGGLGYVVLVMVVNVVLSSSIL